MPTNHDQKLWPLEEASKILGCSPWTLRRHKSRGTLHVIRIGRRIYLNGGELERITKNGLPSLRAK
jgi:helix-turn-helix protein